MKRIDLSFNRIDQSPSDLSTKFQGFLMENLEPDYVTWLHEQETNPYSLKIIHQKDKTLWSLHLLADEAVKQILPVLLELKKVELHDLPTLMVESLSMQDLSSEQLFEFFNENQDRSLMKKDNRISLPGRVRALSDHASHLSEFDDEVCTSGRESSGHRRGNPGLLGQAQ